MEAFVKFELPFKPTVEQLADFQAKLGVNFKYVGSVNSLYVYTHDPLTLKKVAKIIDQLKPAEAIEFGGDWQGDDEFCYKDCGSHVAIIKPDGQCYDLEIFQLDGGEALQPVYKSIVGSVEEAKIELEEVALADWFGTSVDFPDTEELASPDFAKKLDKVDPELWGEVCSTNWKTPLKSALEKYFSIHKKPITEIREFLRSLTDKDLTAIRHQVMKC